MKSPWKSVAPVDARTEYLVLASSIPPKSIRSTWRLFRGSSAVRRQLTGTDGVIGFSMLARPFRKQYATLSVWRDEAALDAFARSRAAHPAADRAAPGDGGDEVRPLDDHRRPGHPFVGRGAAAPAVTARRPGGLAHRSVSWRGDPGHR